MDNFQDEVIKVVPPVGVSVTSFLGIPLSDWVYIATIIYIVFNIICVCYKTFKNKELNK